MIVLDLNVDQSVTIGDDVVVTLREKSGRRAQLAIEAPRDVKVKRRPAPNDTRIQPVEALAPLKHID